jgi:hypothetical protein
MQMMSPYYAGGLGIPYMMGMGGMGESIGALGATPHADDLVGYGMGMGMYPGMMGMGGMGLGMGGMGLGYPYGMMAGNPYMYSGMVSAVEVLQVSS